MSGEGQGLHRAIAAALVVALSSVARAQVQVPAIQANATATASATVAGPSDQPAAVQSAPPAPNAAPSDRAEAARPVQVTPSGPTDHPAASGQNQSSHAASMPPPIPLVSSNTAALNAKEKAGVAIARRWASGNAMPHAGEDGYVRFLFGATLPTVVCAPLQVCNLALQPGEIVNNVNLGDSVRWKITPSVSGSGATQTTHLIIKPTDAGLLSSLDVETNRRTYAVKLVSTQASWMPLVAFNYPDDAKAQWQAYQQAVGFGTAATTLPTGENIANLQFLCISGGPSWTPIRAYTDGAKTYIEFSSAISHQAAPALVALANDGTWFSRPSAQVVNYRVMGNRYVVDAALDRAALISGVGGSQERVVISRGNGCR